MIRAEGVSGCDDSGHKWRKSTRSYGSGSCLEVAAPHDTGIYVRDSKDPHGPVLRFSTLKWNAFLTGVRNSEPGL